MKFSSPILLALTAMLTALILFAGTGEAATKKKPKKPEPEQSIYDMPLRVVVVRNIIGNCEPLCPQWISAEGQITAKSPAVFRKALAKLGDQKLPVSSPRPAAISMPRWPSAR